jgi:hypothetical protein
VTRALSLSAALVLTLLPGVAAAQPRYIDGVFVHPGTQPIELLVFADRTYSGQLRFSNGAMDDVPVVDTVQRVLCSLPNWKPVGVWLSTLAIFRNEYSERRQLRYAARPISIYAMELRISDMEKRDTIDRLLKNVRATPDNPGLLFITMEAAGITRDYIVQLGNGER